MKFHGGVRGARNNKWLNFSGDPDYHNDWPIGNPPLGLLAKLAADFDEIFKIALQGYQH